MGLRRKAREYALKALYEWDFDHGKRLAQIADKLHVDNNIEVEALRFMSELLNTFDERKEIIDSTIEEFSSHWKLPRMASVDRNILRLGVTEIMFLEDVPKSVTINECLEIAKKYGTEDSSSFVNGVLDKINKS